MSAHYLDPRRIAPPVAQGDFHRYRDEGISGPWHFLGPVQTPSARPRPRIQVPLGVPAKHTSPTLSRATFVSTCARGPHEFMHTWPEPRGVFERTISEYIPVTGLENGVYTIGPANPTLQTADLRRMSAFVVMRAPRRRHGFVRNRHALTPNAFGLMTRGSPRQR